MHHGHASHHRLPWEDMVEVTDGASCGFAAPARSFSPAAGKPGLRKAG